MYGAVEVGPIANALKSPSPEQLVRLSLRKCKAKGEKTGPVSFQHARNAALSLAFCWRHSSHVRVHCDADGILQEVLHRSHVLTVRAEGPRPSAQNRACQKTHPPYQAVVCTSREPLPHFMSGLAPTSTELMWRTSITSWKLFCIDRKGGVVIPSGQKPLV